MSYGQIASTALKVVGSGFQAYGAAQGYLSTRATNKYNKAILDSNEIINASIEELNIRRIREEGEGILGQQRAAMAKSGTTFSGSNLDVFMDSLRNIELDVISTEISGMIRTAGVEQEKLQLDVATKRAKAAAILNVTSSFLQSGSSIAQGATSGTRGLTDTRGGAGSTILTSSGPGTRTGLSSRG